jgi:hypothetical protein
MGLAVFSEQLGRTTVLLSSDEQRSIEETFIQFSGADGFCDIRNRMWGE